MAFRGWEVDKRSRRFSIKSNSSILKAGWLIPRGSTVKDRRLEQAVGVFKLELRRSRHLFALAPGGGGEENCLLSTANCGAKKKGVRHVQVQHSFCTREEAVL